MSCTGYVREGFLAIQDAVDDTILERFLEGKPSLEQFRSTRKYLRRHPYPPYRKDGYVLVLQQQFPLIIMLSFVVIVLGIVRDIVLEKEKRLKVNRLANLTCPRNYYGVVQSLIWLLVL